VEIRAREKRWWYYKNTPKSPSTLRWTWNLQENRTINVTNDRWSFTFNAPYANYHQEWWRRLPKRAILDIDNTTGAEIVRSMQKKINRDIWISWLQA
jgi:phage gpG-like protein